MEKLKILVVDDESRMRKLVRDFLVRQDYEVLEAGDGEEALDIFYREKDIALLILDVMMPKMNGWEVCREVRENSKVPIIMLTAKSDESDELIVIENAPLYVSYNPAQIIKLAGKHYLTGAVVFFRTDNHGNIVSLTVEDIYRFQTYLETHSVTLMADDQKLPCICIG